MTPTLLGWASATFLFTLQLSFFAKKIASLYNFSALKQTEAIDGLRSKPTKAFSSKLRFNAYILQSTLDNGCVICCGQCISGFF
jgi:hypothetical protein